MNKKELLKLDGKKATVKFGECPEGEFSLFFDDIGEVRVSLRGFEYSMWMQFDLLQKKDKGE